MGPRPGWARPDGCEAGLHPSNIHDSAYPVGYCSILCALNGASCPSGSFCMVSNSGPNACAQIGDVPPSDTSSDQAGSTQGTKPVHRSSAAGACSLPAGRVTSAELGNLLGALLVVALARLRPRRRG